MYHLCVAQIRSSLRTLANHRRTRFLLLSTQALEPSGVYESVSSEYEEVLELPDGCYLNRSHFDEDSLGYDEEGDEMPIPEPHRLVCRFLSGKFHFVAKRSCWNRDTATYDGRHSKMTPSQIRSRIENFKKSLL